MIPPTECQEIRHKAEATMKIDTTTFSWVTVRINFIMPKTLNTSEHKQNSESLGHSLLFHRVEYMHWAESIFLSSLSSQTLPLCALEYMVPLSLMEAWLAFEDTTPVSAFSSCCSVLSYTPFTEDLEVVSLILVATFRYFYCFPPPYTQQLTQLLWSTCFQTTTPLYWAIYQPFANSSLSNHKFRFWSSVFLSTTTHAPMFGDFGIHKNHLCKHPHLWVP